MDRPLVTVFGATGAPGGSLVRALLADPARAWRVRAATRQAGGAAARALAELGAEIIEADLDDAPTVRRALRGAHGAFFVTHPWIGAQAAREQARAATLADAAALERVRHVLWSTLDDPRAALACTPPCPGATRDTERSFAERGVPLTRLLAALPWDQLLRLGLGPQRDAEGRLVLALPLGRARLPGIACRDIGACAAELLRRGEHSTGGALGLTGEHLDGAQMAAALARVLGEPVRYAAREPDQPPGCAAAADLLDILRCMRRHEPVMRAARASNVAPVLHPPLTRFEAWLRGDGAALLGATLALA